MRLEALTSGVGTAILTVAAVAHHLRPMTQFTDVVGYAAGLLATAAFVPQVAKTFKARSARDISLGMYLLFCAGVGLWLVYGFLIASWPVVVSNFVTLVLAGAVLALKLRYG